MFTEPNAQTHFVPTLLDLWGASPDFSKPVVTSSEYLSVVNIRGGWWAGKYGVRRHFASLWAEGTTLEQGKL